MHIATPKVIAALAILVAVALWLLRPESANPAGSAELRHPAGIATDDQPKATPASAPARRGRAPGTIDHYLQPRDPPSLMAFEPVRPRTLVAGEDSVVSMFVTPLMAMSPEERTWLDQNGYPTQEDVDRLGELTEHELAERATRGDPADQALLGRKQMELGNVLAGLRNLEEAAARGSIWAIHELGRQQALRGNTVEALAWFYVTAARGDWRIPSQGIDMLRNVNTTHVSLAIRYARRYMANLRRLRASLGYVPTFTNRSRPGQEAPQRPEDRVPVFDRRPRR